MSPGTNNNGTTDRWDGVVTLLDQFGLDPAEFERALTYVHQQAGSYSGCLIAMNGTTITIPQQLVRASADISPGVVSGTSK